MGFFFVTVRSEGHNILKELGENHVKDLLGLNAGSAE